MVGGKQKRAMITSPGILQKLERPERGAVVSKIKPDEESSVLNVQVSYRESSHKYKCSEKYRNMNLVKM